MIRKRMVMIRESWIELRTDAKQQEQETKDHRKGLSEADVV